MRKEKLTLWDDKLGVELESSKEDMLSCKNSRVVEDSSNEEIIEESKEEGCKERGESSSVQWPTSTLSNNLICVIMANLVQEIEDVF